MLDFDALTTDQLDQLTGAHREAWYAHVRGDTERRDEILATYPDLADPTFDESEPEPAAEVETADAPAVEQPDVETADARPSRRRRAAAAE